MAGPNRFAPGSGGACTCCQCPTYLCVRVQCPSGALVNGATINVKDGGGAIVASGITGAQTDQHAISFANTIDPDDSLTLSTSQLGSTGSFYIAMWLKPASVAGVRGIFLQVASGTLDWEFYQSSSSLIFKVNKAGGAGSVSVTKSTVLASGTWVHAMAYYDGTNIGIITNGGSATTTAVGAALASPASTTTTVANTGGSSPNGFSGAMDEVFFGSAPTSSFSSIASTLYAGGTGVAYGCIPPATRAGMGIQYVWDMDESSGDRVDTIADVHLVPGGAPTQVTGKVPSCSDGSGGHCFNLVSAGTYTVEVSHPDYIPALVSQDVVTTCSTAKSVTIELSKKYFDLVVYFSVCNTCGDTFTATVTWNGGTYSGSSSGGPILVAGLPNYPDCGSAHSVSVSLADSAGVFAFTPWTHNLSDTCCKDTKDIAPMGTATVASSDVVCSTIYCAGLPSGGPLVQKTLYATSSVAGDLGPATFNSTFGGWIWSKTFAGKLRTYTLSWNCYVNTGVLLISIDPFSACSAYLLFPCAPAPYSQAASCAPDATSDTVTITS